MARTTLPKAQETGPESDRFEETPHPRENYNFFGHAKAEADFFAPIWPDICRRPSSLADRPASAKPRSPGVLPGFFWRTPIRPRPLRRRRRSFLCLRHHPVSHQIGAMAHPDLIVLRREWNPTKKSHFTQIQVEDVRRAIHMFQQAAGQGGYRVCILDCAEDLNPNSANALLKLIEEPPPRSLFLIVAHRPGRMLPTLRSRCQKILLKPLAPADIDADRGGARTALVERRRHKACGRDGPGAGLGPSCVAAPRRSGNRARCPS